MSKTSSSSKTKGSHKRPGPLKETCPSFRRGHLPKEQDVERLRNLTKPHVESFNYFLDEGLAKGIQDIEPAELDLIDPKQLRDDRRSIDWDDIYTIKFWIENVKIGKPTKPTTISGNQGKLTSNKLLPHECRERSLVYSGQISGSVCYQIIQRRNGIAMDGVTTKIPKTFGKLPIMVGSKLCHLHDLSPKQLIQLRERGMYF